MNRVEAKAEFSQQNPDQPQVMITLEHLVSPDLIDFMEWDPEKGIWVLSERYNYPPLSAPCDD